MPTILPLVTSRLTLRSFEPRDVAMVVAYRNDPEVARYQGWELPFSVERAEALFGDGTVVTGPEAGRWVQIAIDLDGAVVGDVAVGLDATGLVATIGYTLAPAHQGRGLGREAVGAVVDALFEIVGVVRVEALLDPRNVASARLVEDLGLIHEGVSPSAHCARGEWVADSRYGLTQAARQAWLDRPRNRPANVTLVPITPANLRVVERLATTRSQERFVATVLQSFADAMYPDDDDGVVSAPWLRLVEADGEPAGFMMVNDPTPESPEPYLWRLLVDRRHQGRGVGSMAIDALCARLRAEGSTSLTVSWVPGPGGPEAFYLRRGFVPTGEVDDDEIVARLAL